MTWRSWRKLKLDYNFAGFQGHLSLKWKGKRINQDFPQVKYLFDWFNDSQRSIGTSKHRKNCKVSLLIVRSLWLSWIHWIQCRFPIVKIVISVCYQVSLESLFIRCFQNIVAFVIDFVFTFVSRTAFWMYFDCLFVGQVMFPHHSDQISQRS